MAAFILALLPILKPMFEALFPAMFQEIEHLATDTTEVGKPNDDLQHRADDVFSVFVRRT